MWARGGTTAPDGSPPGQEDERPPENRAKEGGISHAHPYRMCAASETENGDPRSGAPVTTSDLLFSSGGAKGSRTPDLWYAKPALCQLSYGPWIRARTRSPHRAYLHQKAARVT